MAVATGIFVLLTCYLEPDDEVGGYVSRCPALGVASQGETLMEAEANIREALAMYLGVLADDGDLERILREHQVKLAVEPWPRSAIRVRTSDGGLELVAPFAVYPPSE